MKDFDEWLEGIQSLALKELAGGGEHLRALKKPEVLALVRADPELALRSWRLERDARAAVAAMDPDEVRAEKARRGLIG